MIEEHIRSILDITLDMGKNRAAGRINPIVLFYSMILLTVFSVFSNSIEYLCIQQIILILLLAVLHISPRKYVSLLLPIIGMSLAISLPLIVSGRDYIRGPEDIGIAVDMPDLGIPLLFILRVVVAAQPLLIAYLSSGWRGILDGVSVLSRRFAWLLQLFILQIYPLVNRLAELLCARSSRIVVSSIRQAYWVNASSLGDLFITLNRYSEEVVQAIDSRMITDTLPRYRATGRGISILDVLLILTVSWLSVIWSMVL